MKWKTTLVLLLVTVGVGAYVSLYELKQPTSERQEELVKQVVQIAPDEVTSLVIALPQGTTELARQDEAWRLVSPLQARADESRIRRALSQLDPLTAERVLQGSKDTPLALADFGLDPPRGTLSVATKEGKTTTLQFGDPTPVEDNRYLKLPDSPVVFVVNDGLFEDLNHPAEAYRSKALLDVMPSQVTKVELVWQDVSWMIEKLEGQWKASAGQEILDTAKVEEWLWKLRDLKLVRFVDDPAAPARRELQPGRAGGAGAPTDLARYGLDPPKGRLLVWVADQSEPAQLLVGDLISGGAARYGRTANRPSVVELPDTINELLTTKPESLKPSQPAPAAATSSTPPTP